jgi:uncharacterized protein
MKCPIDGTDLVISDRSGIEIDYCPKCRGVWLDRGELDKIIERASQMEIQRYGNRPAPNQPSYNNPPRRSDDYYEYDDDDYKRKNEYDDDRRYPPGQYPQKKRKSLLGDIFDIFD